MAIIYGIFDSLGACVYVGRTKMTLQQRFISHKTKARRSGSSPFHIWLKNELQSSRNIEAIELEKCPESLMSKRESFWIKKLSPAKNAAKPHDGGKKKCDIDWSPFIHMLGIDHDSEIALLAGVTRKAVSYKRKCLEIPAFSNVVGRRAISTIAKSTGQVHLDKFKNIGFNVLDLFSKCLKLQY